MLTSVRAVRAAVRSPFTKMVRFGSSAGKGHEQLNISNPHNIPAAFITKRTVRTVNMHQFLRKFPVYTYVPYGVVASGILYFLIGM